METNELAEIEAHITELELNRAGLLIESKKARLSRERTHANGAACICEIEAIWLRGFLRRCSERMIDGPGNL